MKKLRRNTHGISNVLGYLLSFCVASIVMVSAVILTNGIIENRTAAVAGMQAQSMANKVADAIVEAMSIGSSSSDTIYSKAVELPQELAGRNYYIEVGSNSVFVNTTDGLISKSSPTYGSYNTNIGVSGKRTYGGAGAVNVSLQRSNVLYKLDFGTGNLSKHSPVESGYYVVTNDSSFIQEERDIPWWNTSYHYRIPILVQNDSSEDLYHMPLQIVLNPSNFDYSHAYVDYPSPTSSNVTSDLIFIDNHFSAVSTITTEQDTWYTWWTREELTEGLQVEITIDSLSEGYAFDQIEGTSLKVNGVPCESWSAATHIASFDPEEALLSLVDGSAMQPKEYRVVLSGLFEDGVPFEGYDTVTVTSGDILVDDDYTSQTLGIGITRFTSVNDGVDAASACQTVFVFNGDYSETVTIYTDDINLIGEDNIDTYINTGSAIKPEVITVGGVNDITINTFRITSGYTKHGIGVYQSDNIDITNCTIYECVNGIFFDDVTNSRIMKCTIYDTYSAVQNDGNGILFTGESTGNLISHCELYDHKNDATTGDAIDFDGIHVTDNVIENCVCYNNDDDGISIESSDIAIRNCTCYNNEGAGVFITDSDHVTIINSTCSYCLYGIYFFNGNDCEILNCGFFNNTMDGIHIDGVELDASENNLIKNCELFENGENGIDLRYVDLTTIEDCNVYDNGWDDADAPGILLDASGELRFLPLPVTIVPNYITNCNVYRNANDGIRLAASCYNEIAGCNVFDNGDDGCELRVKVLAGIEVYSNFNLIQDCNFYCNEGAGLYVLANWPLYLIGCCGNTITNNNFVINDVEPVYDENELLLNDYSGNHYVEADGSVGASPWYITPGSQVDNNAKVAYRLNPDFIIVESGHISTWYDIYGYHVPFIQNGVDIVEDGGIVCIYKPYNMMGVPSYSISNDINIDKTLKLWGGEKYYEYEVRLKGNAARPTILNITADDVAIQRLNISKGVKGIHVKGTFSNHIEDVLIQDCIILDNDNGIYLEDATDVNITSCNIIDNLANGIFMKDSYVSDPVAQDRGVQDCIISNNGENGIEITALPGGQPMYLRHCCIFENSEDGVFLWGDPIESVIETCIIHDNGGDGVHTLYVEDISIQDSTIYDNSEHGIHINGTSNSHEIDGCNIFRNTRSGICIYNSNSNEITHCTIYDNDEDGVQCNSSASNNIIDFCEIFRNSGNGVHFYSSSSSNHLEHTNIRSNNGYGCRIISSSNNEIYHNNFEKNAKGNAYDSGSNTWDNGYISLDPMNPGGGNHWGDFDDGWEGAYDFYQGAPTPQTEPGSDGIVDKPYKIPGGNNQDNYPIGGGKHDIRPYYIEYWNPKGDSIIYVNISMNRDHPKYLCMYYGCNGTLTDFHLHSQNDIAYFFEDFNDQDSVNEVWDSYEGGGDIEIAGGKITFTSEGAGNPHIATKGYVINEFGDPTHIAPPSVSINQSIYVIEARMMVKKGEGDVFLQAANGGSSSYATSYLLAINTTPSQKLSILKYRDMFGEELVQEETAIPFMKQQWLRLASLVHMKKTLYRPDYTPPIMETKVTLKSQFFNFESFGTVGELTCLDTDSYYPVGNPVGDPYLEGKIGLGCRIHEQEYDSMFVVDWIRVLKLPFKSPTVVIGSFESANYGWEDYENVWGRNAQTPDPYTPGPILRDYNNGTEPATFVIRNLPADRYALTISMGNYSGPCPQMNVDILSGDESITYGSLKFPGTALRAFDTKTMIIEKTKDITDSLKIRFSGDKWMVNELIIEQGGRGINVGSI